MTPTVHRAVRLLCLVGFAAGVGLAMHRLRRTPEQEDLGRYVAEEVPKLQHSEVAIRAQIDRLARAPGLPPDAARTLLVDDVLPRLVRLRKQIDEVRVATAASRALNDEYRAVTERLIDACRTCVRVIDDPKLSTDAGVAEVRRGFDEAERAYRSWDEHVRRACVLHRLAPPSAAP